MIIHYIQLRMISKKLRLCQGRTLKFYEFGFMRKCHDLIINRDIESGRKILHAKAEQKLLRIIIDKDLNF